MEIEKYNKIHVDGSLSTYGGAVACLSYSDGKHRIIKLPTQNDSFNIEYIAFIEILKELNGLDQKHKSIKREIITDSLNMYKEVNGKQISSRPDLLEQVLNLISSLNINLIWRSRKYNEAGAILEHRINCLKGQRMSRYKYRRNRS